MLITNKTIGINIAHYRKGRKITQIKLASISGLYPRYLSDIETGRKVPQIPALARLATGLGVSIEELVGSRSSCAPRNRQYTLHAMHQAIQRNSQNCR